MMPALFISGIVALCGLADAPDRPPPLTFDRHVDYIAWWNERVSRGKTESAFPLYEKLWKGEEGQGGMPPLEGAAKEQYDRIGYRPWDAAEYPEFAAYLRRCEPYIEILKKVVGAPDFWQPIPDGLEPLLTVTMPYIDTSREASRALIKRAWMKDGNQAEALMEGHRIVLHSAGHMQHAGPLIGGLVGSAERVFVYESVLAALNENIISRKGIELAYHVLRKDDPRSPDWNLMLDCEWAFTLDALQFACPNGKLDKNRWNRLRNLLSTAPARKPPPSAGFDPREANEWIDQCFEQGKRIVSGPIGAATRDRFCEHQESESLKLKKNAFTHLMHANLERVYETMLRAEARRRGTMLVLAVHAHHAKHGKWPTSLAKIDGKLGLKGLKYYRKDPFSGKNFNYAVRDGEPHLYSIGTDGKDDGGRHDAKWGEGGGDFVFWPHRP